MNKLLLFISSLLIAAILFVLLIDKYRLTQSIRFFDGFTDELVEAYDFQVIHSNIMHSLGFKPNPICGATQQLQKISAEGNKWEAMPDNELFFSELYFSDENNPVIQCKNSSISINIKRKTVFTLHRNLSNILAVSILKGSAEITLPSNKILFRLQTPPGELYLTSKKESQLQIAVDESQSSLINDEGTTNILFFPSGALKNKRLSIQVLKNSASLRTSYNTKETQEIKANEIFELNSIGAIRKIRNQ